MIIGRAKGVQFAPIWQQRQDVSLENTISNTGMICALHPSSSPLPLTTPIPNYDVWMKEIYLKKRTPNKIYPSYFFETIWDCASMYWTWSWTTYTICGKDMVWFLSLKVCLPQKCSGKRFHRRSRLCVCYGSLENKIWSEEKYETLSSSERVRASASCRISWICGAALIVKLHFLSDYFFFKWKVISRIF